jgi:hypothetical protein
VILIGERRRPLTSNGFVDLQAVEPLWSVEQVMGIELLPSAVKLSLVIAIDDQSEECDCPRSGR